MQFRRLLSALVGFALFGTGALAQTPQMPQTPKQLTAAQWREDLRFMMREIEGRHVNPYHHVSKAELETAAAKLDAEIPKLDRNEVIVGMMRIAAMVGDGHTRVDPRKDPAFGFRSLPVRFYGFDDGMWVRAVDPAHGALLGARVEAIGGVPIEEAIRRVSALASRENTSGPRLYAPLYLAMPDVLQAVGLSSSREQATLTLSRDGRRWTEAVNAGEVAALWPPDTDASLFTPSGWKDARAADLPLWLQAPLNYHRLIELPARNALYAQLNMITSTKDQSLEQFGQEILAKAEATNPRAVILDLRLSYGGNGDLRNRFIPSLVRAEDSDTKLFVLTGRGTFSASQFLLDDLDRLTDAVFIGEPASSRPTGYGDGYRSTMPNSGISIRTSIKRWQSGQDMREWTPIDIAPAYNFADYVAGRDPALEAALSFKPEQMLEQRLASVASAGAGALDRVRSDPVYRYADLERAATTVAQRLMRDDKASALRIARWAAERLPKSTDAATVLAFVADSAGLRDEARKAALAAVAIDPNNRSVRAILERPSS
jgi:hypothetical protein